MSPLRLLLASFTVVAALSRVGAAETLVVSYSKTWDFLNPMGTNPRNADSDFDNTWWLPEEEFAIDYNGPAFNIVRSGTPGTVTSINSGSGQGPIGYGSVDNWSGQSAPVLYPFEGGPPIMDMGKTLTTPNNTNRKASYYRTTFYTNQVLMRPVIRCMIDDGAVIFIDGVQVARVNLSLPTPSALPTYTTFAIGDGITKADLTPYPVPQSSEDTLLTIDLSTAGIQGTQGGLQSEVINPLESLIAGTHTIAVFLCSFSASSPDQLMALQMTANDAGISAFASNVTRNAAGTPGNPLDDTFEFDVTVTHTGGGTHGWTSSFAGQPSGSYSQVLHFASFPATGPATITFKDADSPELLDVLRVDPPAAPLSIGQVLLPNQTGPLFCTADTSTAWIQTAAESVELSNGGAVPQMLKSSVVQNLPVDGASFEAILEFLDSSSSGNFEANDTLQAQLILQNGVTSETVNLIPRAIDSNGDGLLNGYSGDDYNIRVSSDEFNLAARPAESAWAEGLALTWQIPPGTISAQLVIHAANDNGSEAFRVKAVRFAPAQGVFDHDLDGIPDADEFSAGTDPFNAASSLKVNHVRNGSAVAVTFQTVPDRTYRILSSVDMVNWTQENVNSIVGDGSVQGYAVNGNGSTRKFIYVQVKRGLQPFP